MKIEPTMISSLLDRAANSSVEPLESRLLAAREQAPDSKRPDPEFDHLYQLLLAMEGQGKKAIYEFLRTLRGPDGVTAAYPTAKALKEITNQVMVRMYDEGLEKSSLYKEVFGANAMAFGMEVYVMGVTREVFQPMGDEAWEKSEW